MKPRLPLLRLATALRRAESLLFPPRFRLSSAPVAPRWAGGSLLLEVHRHVLEIFLSKIPPYLCPGLRVLRLLFPCCPCVADASAWSEHKRGSGPVVLFHQRHTVMFLRSFCP
ncbi:hypothetical protein MUK42_32948 [Musa troglodytarum]|uniref:Uncharacterized protein n=1 Tax=Musa troglodytarum TaxID=320322 RepID=A0A9E7I261_9LILI|nr:hypothetical protein MUK42_32948 [Musa troglodytarum]